MVLETEMQLYVDEESDQSIVSGIMPFKDSVKCIEMDKNSFESDSNKISIMGLNTVENCESREEQVMELNESKVIGNANELQLSVDEESDQSIVSGITPFKDSVKCIEVDKNSFESDSNKISIMGLNIVENCESREEQVMELDESKVIGNANEKNCEMKKIVKRSENQYECDGLKRTENNVNLKEKDADVFKNTKDKCSLAHNELNFSSDMKSCKVMIERLKPHIQKRYFHLSNLNPIHIIQPNVEKGISFNTDIEEIFGNELNRNSITKIVQNVNEGEKMSCQGNSHKIDIMGKHNSKPKQVDKLFSVGKNSIYVDSAKESCNRCANLIKCSTCICTKNVPAYEKFMGISLLNESFENKQEIESMSSDKNKIQELDEKLLNLQKSCKKRIFSERELIVEKDWQFHSKSNDLFKSKLLNLKDRDSPVSKISNSCKENDKTQDSSFTLKPCKVMLEKLNSETLKMYSPDVCLFSNLVSEGDAICSVKGTILLNSHLHSFPDKQEHEEIVFKKIQNDSPFKRLKESSHQKLASKLRNNKANLESQKNLSSKINEKKEIVTEMNNNLKNHFLDFDLIKVQDVQKREFKGTSRVSTYLQNLKHAKRSRKSSEATDVKNKKWRQKSNFKMKLNMQSNNLIKLSEKNSQEVKYSKKEIQELYSIKECKIVLEKLDYQIEEIFLCNPKLIINQVSQLILTSLSNIYSDVNAHVNHKIVHIDKDGNGPFKSQRHLMKNGPNKTSEECTQSVKLMKEHILKTNMSFDTKSNRKTGPPSLKMNSSEPDNAVYNSWKCKAEGPVLCSDDSLDNPHLNFNLQMNAIDDNCMELDEANTLIGQIPIKKCYIILEKCDSAILEKYLGDDWSTDLSKRDDNKSFIVDLMDFEDSIASNSTNDVYSDSDYGNISDSSCQVDSSSESDNGSFGQALEFCNKKNPKNILCKLCKKQFKTYSLLLSHDKKTHQTYSFKCVLCKAVSKNRESYINHMKRNHPEVEPYVCDYPKCEESFKTKKQLSDHKLYHQRYCCRFCKKRYGKKSFLEQHVSEYH